MMLKALLLDNPILIRHLRARLRRQHLLPLIAVVIIVAACLTWLGLGSPEEGGAYGRRDAQYLALTLLLGLQGIILFFGGAAQVTGSVMQARESGLLDFHRISPQRPLALCLGFLLGAPIREYILFACTLPFLLVLVVDADFGTAGLLLVWVDMVVAALLYYVVALLFGLALPKARSVTVLVVLCLAVLQLFWLVSPLTYFTIYPTMATQLRLDMDMLPFRTTFFAQQTPAFLLSWLHQIPLGIFLLLAAVRKMRRERAHAFSRPVAILFYAVLAVLLLGGSVWAHSTSGYGPVGYINDGALITLVYGLWILGLCLSASVTPGLSDVEKGIRHARKLGQARVPAWSDAAVNWPPSLAFAGVLLATGGVAAILSFGDITRYVMAVAAAACTLLYFCLGKQLFSLFFRRNSQTYFALTLFFVWIVPLLISMIAGVTEADERTMVGILSISPLSGFAQAIIAYELFTDYGQTSHFAGVITLGVSLGLLLICVPFYVFAARKVTGAAQTEDGPDRPSVKSRPPSLPAPLP